MSILNDTPEAQLLKQALDRAERAEQAQREAEADRDRIAEGGLLTRMSHWKDLADQAATERDAAEQRVAELTEQLEQERKIHDFDAHVALPEANSYTEHWKERAEAAEAERDRARWHLAIFIAPVERLVAGLRPYLGEVVEQVIPALEQARSNLDKRILDEARAALDEAVQESQPPEGASE